MPTMANPDPVKTGIHKNGPERIRRRTVAKYPLRQHRNGEIASVRHATSLDPPFGEDRGVRTHPQREG